jgi:hypothetical protein
MIEHPFRRSAISGQTVSSYTALDGPIYQSFFRTFFENMIKCFVNRVPRDLSGGKLPRKPRSA